MTNYLTTDANSSLRLVPGKLYAADFLVSDTNDLSHFADDPDFTKIQKQTLEAELKKIFADQGHEVTFTEFVLDAPSAPVTSQIPFTVTGSYDWGGGGMYKPLYPARRLRVYFKIKSVTVLILIGILIAVFTTGVLLSAPSFIGVLEASGDIVTTVKDLGVGIIQEPRKFAELGLTAIIPILVLIAAVSFFLLKPYGGFRK